MNDESAEKYLEATIRQQPRHWLIDKKRNGRHLRRPAQKRQHYLCLYSCQGWLFTDNGAI